MNWSEIKKSIHKQLLARNLSKPEIRLNALENIEKLLDKKLLTDPDLFLSTNKEAIKEYLSKKKKLNSAEASIINHIYDVLNGNPIPIRNSLKK